jgi:hypothetical protein
MPTRSPSFTRLFSEPGPSLCTIPTPSWPPTCPGCVGYGTIQSIRIKFHERMTLTYAHAMSSPSPPCRNDRLQNGSIVQALLPLRAPVFRAPQPWWKLFRACRKQQPCTFWGCQKSFAELQLPFLRMLMRFLGFGGKWFTMILTYEEGRNIGGT